MTRAGQFRENAEEATQRCRRSWSEQARNVLTVRRWARGRSSVHRPGWGLGGSLFKNPEAPAVKPEAEQDRAR
jgi:hypothetical protein